MLNFLIYKFGEFLALILPLRLSYCLAVFAADLHYLLAKQDRRGVIANLKSIFPEKPEQELKTIQHQVFRNFAKYLVDFFCISKFNARHIEKAVRIINRHYLDEAISRGRGVITLTAHIGNWEFGGVVIAMKGYPFSVVAMPHKHRLVDDFFNSKRQSKGIKVIPLGRAAAQCFNTLRDKKILALVGDRDFTDTGAVVDFLGRPTLIPKGAAVLASRTGAVIVPGFMIREKDDTFSLRFEKPLEFRPIDGEAGEKEAVLELILRYKSVIEQYIRRYPEQWYVFRQFWN